MKKNFHLPFSVFLLLTITASAFLTSCSKEAADQSQLNASATDNVFAKANLVAWYTFNGDTKDHSGNGNNADFNSATSTTGKNGTANTAYLFDGTSSYMTVPNSASLNPSTGITIIAVVQPLGFYQGQCHSNRVICKGYNDYDNGRYTIGYDDQPSWNYQGCDQQVNPNKENFYGSYGDGQATVAGVTDIATYIKQDKWYTLAYTFDGRRSTFYVNGVAQAAALSNTTYTPNTNPLFIGRNQDPSFPYYFNGKIDEIRIYNTALTQQTIANVSF
jgi:hypothetical protein